uniref:Uncharacterized protein n=1 Tax=Meloidogyne incognita TaxID=6306 RepID=A0A914P138_MELIC
MPISQISFISAQPLGGIKQLDPKVREGENVFGVEHIFTCLNDTFMHVTHHSGRE